MRSGGFLRSPPRRYRPQGPAFSRLPLPSLAYSRTAGGLGLFSTLMRSLFFVAFQTIALGVAAQEPWKGLGLDLGFAPSFVYTEPVEADNWVGSKSQFGASFDAAINYGFPKARAAFGLGDGIFLWGDRVLYPVFIQVAADPSAWCEDCFFSRGIWLRTTIDARGGAMPGNVETAAGPLRVDFFSEVGFRYRVGIATRWQFHAGIRLGTFDLRGPYRVQVDGVWQDSKPSFLTAGPALWMTF